MRLTRTEGMFRKIPVCSSLAEDPLQFKRDGKFQKSQGAIFVGLRAPLCCGATVSVGAKCKCINI